MVKKINSEIESTERQLTTKLFNETILSTLEQNPVQDHFSGKVKITKENIHTVRAYFKEAINMKEQLIEFTPDIQEIFLDDEMAFTIPVVYVFSIEPNEFVEIVLQNHSFTMCYVSKEWENELVGNNKLKDVILAKTEQNKCFNKILEAYELEIIEAKEKKQEVASYVNQKFYKAVKQFPEYIEWHVKKYIKLNLNEPTGKVL